MVTWAGGQAPFQLLKSTDLKAWVNFTNPTMARSKSFQGDGGQGFFVLREAVELLAVDASFSPGTKLVWIVPELA